MKSSIFILALVVIVAMYVGPSEAIFDRIKCNTIAGLCQGCQRAEYDHHIFKVSVLRSTQVQINEIRLNLGFFQPNTCTCTGCPGNPPYKVFESK